MSNLDEIIKNLKAKPEVDAVFLTGSHGTKTSKPHSDFDLVIVLNKNSKGIRAVYTWIDGRFADIFFFDKTDLDRLANAKDYPANAWDTVLVSWLQKSSVFFDKSGRLSELIDKVKNLNNFSASVKEQRDSWQKINYNYIANERYFKSGDSLYHEALEIRLLYSVSELICGYFILRNIPWRGEKEAIIYLKKSKPDIYLLLQKYWQAKNLKERFGLYTELVDKVFTDDYRKWEEDDVVVTLNNQKPPADDKDLTKLWNGLIAG